MTDAPTPEATEIAGYTPAEQEALVAEGIEIVYAGDPQPDWYADLRIVDGAPDILIDGTSLFIGATSADHAAELCQDIATIAYDDDAKPIGFRHVHVQVGADLVADCDTRE